VWDEWYELRDLASPSLFDVLRPRDLRRQLGELASNAVRREAYEAARAELALRFERNDLPVRFGAVPESVAMDVARRGATVLRLFFLQLLQSDTMLLDLRWSRFRARDGMLWYGPRSLWLRWDPSFLAAARELYVGFYEDDAPRFRGALSRLGIECAEPAFCEQFRRQPPDAMAFRVRELRSAFHAIFLRCRVAGASLHPNFLPLGVALACLYEHLERLGGVHDVRAAFRASRPV